MSLFLCSNVLYFQSKTVPKRNKKKKDKKHADFNEDFEFDFDEETSSNKEGLKTKSKNISKPKNNVEDEEENKDKQMDCDDFEDDERVISGMTLYSVILLHISLLIYFIYLFNIYIWCQSFFL